MSVVDSPVLVAALVDTGSNGTWAEAVLARGSLHATELARVKATNILRRLAKQSTTPVVACRRKDERRLSPLTVVYARREQIPEV